MFMLMLLYSMVVLLVLLLLTTMMMIMVIIMLIFLFLLMIMLMLLLLLCLLLMLMTVLLTYGLNPRFLLVYNFLSTSHFNLHHSHPTPDLNKRLYSVKETRKNKRVGDKNESRIFLNLTCTKQLENKTPFFTSQV